MRDPKHTFDALEARHGPRYRWWLLAATMLGTMASVMASTVVNVAIPDLSLHFQLGQDRAQWVSSGFMAAMTVSMLTTPWLLARFGYRRVYLGCMLALFLGGVVGGVAARYELVLLGRLLEGLAAGLTQPIPAIVMLRAFEGRDQSRASAVFGMGVVLAPALGPSIGGVLVDLFGWRSIFFMVLPFCAGAALMALRFVPDEAPLGGTQRGRGLDWMGLALAGSATLGVLAAVARWREDARLATQLGLGALAAFAGLVLWLRAARRRGLMPLLDTRVFSCRAFTMGGVVAFVYGSALFGSTYLLPVYMQLGLGFSASHVGSVLLPAGLVLALTIGGVGRFAHRFPPHALISVGLGLLALSFALMPTASRSAGLSMLMGWSILGRVGLGLVLPSLNLSALKPLDRELLPAGSSTINYLRTLGGAIGVGSCAVLLEWRIQVHGDHLTLPTTSPARLEAFTETFWVLALVCGLATAAAWRMKPRPGSV